MKKQQKQLIFLGIFLVVLLLCYFGLTKYNERKTQEEEAIKESNTFYVTNLTEGSIKEITFTYEEETLSFIKADGEWKYEADTSLPIMQSRVEKMASSMESLVAESVINTPSDMTQYGITGNGRKVSFSTDSESFAFEIGDYNSAASIYYWHMDGSNDIYAVKGTNVTVFDYSLDDLVEETTENTVSGNE